MNTEAQVSGTYKCIITRILKRAERKAREKCIKTPSPDQFLSDFTSLVEWFTLTPINIGEKKNIHTKILHSMPSSWEAMGSSQHSQCVHCPQSWLFKTSSKRLKSLALQKHLGHQNNMQTSFDSLQDLRTEQ